MDKRFCDVPVKDRSVRRPRRNIIAGLLGIVAVLAGVLLIDVLPTVFFGITVAYVLIPFSDRVQNQGFSRSGASLISTIATLLIAILLFIPMGVVLYLRRREIISIVRGLPSAVTFEFGEFVYTIDASEVISLGVTYFSRFAIELLRNSPVLLTKVVVFVFVVFGVLVRRHELQRALIAPVAAEYHDIAFAINTRIRSTLYTLYIVQVMTSIVTFAVAIPVFWLLGYQYPITLAVVAGVLQFLPVIGPGFLIGGLTLYELINGVYPDAVLVFVFGMGIVALAPDVLLRPRLVSERASLPASLYFVGFVGGVLSLGPVGIIAGPLLVSVLVFLLSMLGTETSRQSHHQP